MVLLLLVVLIVPVQPVELLLREAPNLPSRIREVTGEDDGEADSHDAFNQEAVQISAFCFIHIIEGQDEVTHSHLQPSSP